MSGVTYHVKDSDTSFKTVNESNKQFFFVFHVIDILIGNVRILEEIAF